MMAATGIPLNPITAILSALAIGIGVPFTIHITHRFQEDRLRYEDPHVAIASTVRHTGGRWRARRSPRSPASGS